MFIDECMVKTMWYVCRMEYYSAFKEGNPAICNHMDKLQGRYSEIGWIQKDKYCLIDTML